MVNEMDVFLKMITYLKNTAIFGIKSAIVLKRI